MNRKQIRYWSLMEIENLFDLGQFLEKNRLNRREGLIQLLGRVDSIVGRDFCGRAQPQERGREPFAYFLIRLGD